jgi:hypothetical protein
LAERETRCDRDPLFETFYSMSQHMIVVS